MAGWRLPLILGAAVLLITEVPYVAGYLAEEPGVRFLGFVENPMDSNPYLAWVRQAAEGHLLIESQYSSEQVSAHLFNLMTWLMGNAARILHVPPLAAYEGGRVIFGAVLVAVLWWIAGLFAGGVRRGTRELAFTWMLCGAGASWLYVAVLGYGVVHSPPTVDLRVPEAYAFCSILTFPHFAASMSLALGALGLVWKAMRERRMAPALGAAGAALALGAFHPYPLVMIAGTAALYAAWLVARRRAGPVEIAAAALVVAAAGAGLAWNLFTFSRDPVLAGWRAQNLSEAPAPAQMLIAYFPSGLIAIAALGCWGWEFVARRRSRPGGVVASASPWEDPERLVFLAGWILVVLVAMYAPLGFQRRMIEGLQAPVALVAALAVERVLQSRAAFARRAPLWIGALVLAAVPGTVLIVVRAVDNVRAPAPHYFALREELDAFHWLGEHAEPGSVVLASLENSNRIPRYSDCRVFAAHFCQTLNFRQKQLDAERFYKVAADDVVRAGFLRAAGIRWVMDGPAEKLVGSYNPATSELFEPAFREGPVTIYRVVERANSE